jgi:hypothetical protein
MIKTPNLICDILQNDLQLSDGQIMVYNQRFQIPTDIGLMITVGVQTMKPYANNFSSVVNGSGLDIPQYSNFVELIEINILSSDQSAIAISPLVLMALVGQYSQQQQEANGFYIAPIPQTFDDTSFLEETAQMTRLTIGVRVLRSYDKLLPATYFSTFTEEILTEQGEVP